MEMLPKRDKVICRRYTCAMYGYVKCLWHSREYFGYAEHRGSPDEVSLEEAFSASCPLQATGFFNDETIQIEFTNKSNETITAWTGAVAFYNKNDKVIKGSQGNILWGIK